MEVLEPALYVMALLLRADKTLVLNFGNCNNDENENYDDDDDGDDDTL